MLDIKKHKKIYYMPGMISLIAIPLVFWFWVSEIIKDNSYGIIKLDMPTKEFRNDKLFSNILNEVSYEKIDVPANFTESVETQYYKLIKEFQMNGKENSGLKFQLSPKNTYNDFVRLLNLMEKTNQKYYGFLTEDDSFRVIQKNKGSSICCGGSFESYEELSIFPLFCGTTTHISMIDKIKNKISNAKHTIQTLPKPSYYILTGYFVLLFCAVFKPKLKF